MTPTPEQLQEWRALEQAATPGPWVCYYSLSVGATVQQKGKAGWIFRAQEKATREDLDFVAAARAAVPALLAEVERLTAELDALRENNTRMLNELQDRGNPCAEIERKYMALVEQVAEMDFFAPRQIIVKLPDPSDI